MHSHVLPPEHWLIVMGAQDPITKEKLKPGDSIVVCAHCNIAFLVSSWELEYVHTKHLGINNTKQNINNSASTQRITIAKSPRSRPRVETPPISQPAYTPPLDIRRPVDIRRPTTERMEPRRAKAVGWMLAILFLVVTGIFLWQKYMSEEVPTSIPSSTTFQPAQSGEKPKDLSNRQTATQIPQNAPDLSLSQTEGGTQNTTAETIEKIEFKVISEPDGAEVYLEEMLVGITPVTLKALPGKYKLRIVKDGYIPIRSTVKISSNSKTEFPYNLSELR